MEGKSKSHMKRIQKLFLSVFLVGILVCIILSERIVEQIPEHETGISASEAEMCGIWVASVLNLDYPTAPTSSASELKYQIDAILNNVEEWGFNTIFLQVSPCADALYASEIYPWSVYLTGKQGRMPDSGFDPLDYWVEEAHKRGLGLHAWINPFRITREISEWDGLASNSPARMHPDWVIRYDDNYYYDPGLPQVRHLLVDVVMEIVHNYAVDGIHLDDYFYPGIEFDDAASYADYGKDFTEIGDWRRNNINQLIYDISTSLHNYDPEIIFGVAPNSVWAEKSQQEDGSDTTSKYSSYYDLYADTKYWVESGWLDYIAPQLYFEMGHKTNDFSVLLDWWTNVILTTGGGANQVVYRISRL